MGTRIIKDRAVVSQPNLHSPAPRHHSLCAGSGSSACVPSEDNDHM